MYCNVMAVEFLNSHSCCKGQGYSVGDTLTITVGGGSGETVTVTDIDGSVY